jgi:hypothetical protein
MYARDLVFSSNSQKGRKKHTPKLLWPTMQPSQNARDPSKGRA